MIPPTPAELRDWRRERNLSASQAAGLVYTTARSWLRWEAGAAPMPAMAWDLAQRRAAEAVRRRI